MDDGEELPLHGTVSHIPADVVGIEETNEALVIKLRLTDGIIFGKKLVLNRVYTVSYLENAVKLCDTVVNEGTAASPKRNTEIFTARGKGHYYSEFQIYKRQSRV